MNKKSISFMIFILFFVIGCGSASSSRSTNNSGNNSSSGNSNYSSNEGSNTSPNSSNNSTSQQSNNSGGSNNQNGGINIPSNNDPAPRNILEQLSWSGQGGEADDRPVYINGTYLILRDFNPGQKVEIFFYRQTRKFCGSEALAEYVTSTVFQMDDAGGGKLELNGNTKNIYVPLVIDHDSGETLWKLAYIPFDSTRCGSSDSCPGAPPQRLKVDEMAYVCTSADSVKLREGPGKNYSVIKSLVPGADLKVIGGPTCSDNWSWWKVETESGYVGWMSEGGDSVDRYFLCPRN